MSRIYVLGWGLLAMNWFGCADHVDERPPAQMDAQLLDMTTDQFPADVGADAMVELGEPAYVELSISPRKALYTQSETPRVSAVVYDRLGDELVDYPVRFDTRPVESATVDLDGTVHFSREGAGAVRGCATPDLCGRVSFFVDDSAPLLEVISPTRGEYISGEPTITVEGRTDPGGGVEIYLNDQELDVDDEGYFRAEISAEFGLNLVDLIADDGVRRPATRSVREVVWSPTIQARTGAQIEIQSAASMKIGQVALDGESFDNPEGANPLRALSLTETLELLLVRVDAMGLVENPQLLAGENANLRLVDLQPGIPQFDVLFVENGLEVFFALDGLLVELEGDASITGEVFSLDGEVSVDASAFAQITIDASTPGAFELSIGNYGASVERINALMENETVQIVIEGAETVVGTPLRRFLAQYLDDLIQEELPGVLSVGLDSIFEPLQGIPIEVDEGGPLGSARVDFSLTSVQPRIEPGDGLYFDLSVEMTEPEQIEAPHDTPGIPAFDASASPIWPVNAAFAVALRLSMLNTLLDSLWRQRLLSIDLTPEIPDSLSLLISGARIDARLPPLLVPSKVGAPDELVFQLGELDLVIESPMRTEPDVYVASIRAGFYVNFANGQLTLGLSSATTDIRFELLSAQDGRPILPPATLAGFVEDNLWPQIESNLGEVLSVDLDEVAVDADSLRSLVPGLNYLSAIPTFETIPKAIDGWIVGGASTSFELHFLP